MSPNRARTRSRQRSANVASVPKRFVEQRFQPLADQPRQHGRTTAGRDGDLHRRAIDDRGHDETGQLAVVDHVAGDARGLRGIRGSGVHAAVVGGRDDQPMAVDVVGAELALPPGDSAALERGRQLALEQGRDHGHDGAGLRQQRELARGDVPATHEQHRLAGEIEE
jgi:hypothetical protein